MLPANSKSPLEQIHYEWPEEEQASCSKRAKEITAYVLGTLIVLFCLAFLVASLKGAYPQTGHSIHASKELQGFVMTLGLAVVTSLFLLTVAACQKSDRS